MLSKAFSNKVFLFFITALKRVPGFGLCPAAVNILPAIIIKGLIFVEIYCFLSINS